MGGIIIRPLNKFRRGSRPLLTDFHGDGDKDGDRDSYGDMGGDRDRQRDPDPLNVENEENLDINVVRYYYQTSLNKFRRGVRPLSTDFRGVSDPSE